MLVFVVDQRTNREEKRREEVLDLFRIIHTVVESLRGESGLTKGVVGRAIPFKVGCVCL